MGLKFFFVITIPMILTTIKLFCNVSTVKIKCSTKKKINIKILY